MTSLRIEVDMVDKRDKGGKREADTKKNGEATRARSKAERATRKSSALSPRRNTLGLADFEPPPKGRDASCQKQLRDAVPYDAFSTLMALLRRRLRRRGNASSARGEHEGDHRAWHAPVDSCVRALELGGATASVMPSI